MFIRNYKLGSVVTVEIGDRYRGWAVSEIIGKRVRRCLLLDTCDRMERGSNRRYGQEKGRY
jgi:hypothetical protein